MKQPWLVWLSGLSAGLQTKGSLVQFLVRTHAWVAGQIPSREHARGNHTQMFLSLCLKINKYSLKPERKVKQPTSQGKRRVCGQRLLELGQARSSPRAPASPSGAQASPPRARSNPDVQWVHGDFRPSKPPHLPSGPKTRTPLPRTYSAASRLGGSSSQYRCPPGSRAAGWGLRVSPSCPLSLAWR